MNEMIEFQHKFRCGGVIYVGGREVQLDENGVVLVTEAEALLLSQGACWRPAGTWGDARRPENVATAATTKASATVGGRPVRTKAELLAEAEPGEISSMDQVPADLLKTQPAIPSRIEGTESDESDEEIEVSMSMTKAQLLDVASRLGVDIAAGTPKAEIFEAIAQHTSRDE